MAFVHKDNYGFLRKLIAWLWLNFLVLAQLKGDFSCTLVDKLGCLYFVKYFSVFFNCYNLNSFTWGLIWLAIAFGEKIINPFHGKLFRASLKSSDYYWPEPEPIALRATGQVSTLTELELYPYSSLFYPNLWYGTGQPLISSLTALE